MELAEKLKLLPDSPGVYIMKNETGVVIYVGKAISLKNRVRSYFQSSRGHSPKTRSLVSQIHDFDYILTDSEIEALILECNLIKKHRPRYNVRLVDDKSYPYLKITLDEEYPRAFITRKVFKDGARYYGPYTDAGALRETLNLLRRMFPLRTCRQKSVEGQKRPCLNFHINKCLAPCTGQVDRDRYLGMVRSIRLFLEGRQEDLLKQLTTDMEQASQNLEFEKAAALRDRIRAIETVIEKQKMVSPDPTDQDVLSLAREGETACAAVFFIRSGKLIGREHFILDDTSDLTDQEILTAFVKQYYIQVEYIPAALVLQTGVTEGDLISDWLSQKRGSRVHLKVPKRGEKLKLLEMAAKNAAEELALHRLRAEQAQARTAGALAGLKDFLGLPAPPARIECYDISNIQGTEAVGSMVVFIDGQARPDLYRRFKIKTVEGPNDFASMQEVLRRRFSRAVRERAAIAEGKLAESGAKFAVLPSLVIIDGGKGQLSAGREVMHELGFAAVPTFGLAKEHEYLFGENNPEPIILPRNSESLYLVQRIRDEAHRFAITYHRKLRGQHSLKSVLDDIPGVGPKRRKALIDHFRSMARLRSATVDELAAVPGISRNVAEAVFEFFQEERAEQGNPVS